MNRVSRIVQNPLYRRMVVDNGFEVAQRRNYSGQVTEMTNKVIVSPHQYGVLHLDLRFVQPNRSGQVLTKATIVKYTYKVYCPSTICYRGSL